MLENRSLFTEETIDFSFSVVKVASSDGAAVTRQGRMASSGWWAGSFTGTAKCTSYLLCKGIGTVRHLSYHPLLLMQAKKGEVVNERKELCPAHLHMLLIVDLEVSMNIASQNRCCLRKGNIIL